MSVSDLMVLRGRVGTGLTLRRPEDGGRAFVRFRIVAPRPRRKDNGEWEEGEAQWHTVRAWGPLAEHLAISFHKGQPIIVVGRPAAHAWISNEGEVRSEISINAFTAGHDLGYGVSLYSRLGSFAHNPFGQSRDDVPSTEASLEEDGSDKDDVTSDSGVAAGDETETDQERVAEAA